ncbi:uncharacterized protein L201_004630 [Kwoniella dendrophila CBS 6074]|uniref:Uncharacterized protein n=1 Tax=Kwoniella dendrophila CBS 6074 TaxID=1295534 RepID=A0AAX4JYQ7_9TREE
MSLNPLRNLLRPTTRSIVFPRNSNRSVHYSHPRSSPTSSTTGTGPSSSTTHTSHSHTQHGHQHSHSNGSSSSSSTRNGKKPSPHLVWYREIVPAMIPIFLISTTLFLGLSLIRTHLSHSKLLGESQKQIEELELKLKLIKFEQKKQILREKKERERILPLIVEKVLQRVGVVGNEDGDDDDLLEFVNQQEQEKQKELPRLL